MTSHETTRHALGWALVVFSLWSAFAGLLWFMDYDAERTAAVRRGAGPQRERPWWRYYAWGGVCVMGLAFVLLWVWLIVRCLA